MTTPVSSAQPSHAAAAAPASLDQDALKTLVGQAALHYVVPGQIVGVGTGSTVNKFIDALASMKADIAGAVSSSEASTARLQALGIRVFDANEVERLRETLRLCEEGLRDCASTARIARQWLTQQTGVGLAAAPAVSALRMIQNHAEGYMLGAEMEFPRPPAAGAPASPLGFLPPEPVSAAMPMQMELISDLAPGLAEAARVFLAAWRAGDVDLPYGPAELRDVQSAFFLWAGQRPGMLPEYLSKVDLERLLASGGVVARKQKVACPGPARFGRSPNVERVVFFMCRRPGRPGGGFRAGRGWPAPGRADKRRAPRP